jgi:hypothetical protein
MDWGKAEKHLRECEQTYVENGLTERSILISLIKLLRDRFDRKERTRELYNEIMNITL